MKFSAFLLFHRFDDTRSFREVYDYNLAVAEFLEECGFDAVWVSEHHFRDYGTVPDVLGMLAYLAGRTTRLRLGTGVVVLPLHNPLHVAEQAAQVDVLSGGRLEFGVGRGYQGIEFEGFATDLSEARDRYEEALELVLNAWTTPGYEHRGKFFQTGTVNLVPRPIQQPHPPVHVAAVSPQTVERHATRGIPILADPAAPFRKVQQAAATWREAAAAAGHDADAAELVISRSVYVAPTLQKAHEDQERFEQMFDRSRIFNVQSAPVDSRTGEFAEGFEFWEQRYLKGGSVTTDFRWEQLEVIGDPERVISQVQMLQEFGYQHLMCDFGSTRPIPLDEMLATVRLFAEEVMPAFR
jgi:alkanesulfonate monooxygenase SsuD/methylene tetrahydromethanopterin reductase-like flavin-dependent oxidoreductase (luciferase family)